METGLIPQSNTAQSLEVMNFSVIRKPEEVLKEAHEVAVALKKAISDRYKMQKREPLAFNNRQYLELEDWQMIGKFYAITVKVVSSEPVQYGEAFGFKARAAAFDIRRGVQISEAEALCMNDEEKWRARPKYEYHYVLSDGTKQKDEPSDRKLMIWEPNPNKPGKSLPKKERVLIGDEKVPTFQLMSMSQTRACSKALKLALSWVATMAGYEATPAEEMDEATAERQETTAAIQTPKAKEPEKTQATATSGTPSPTQEAAPQQSTPSIPDKSKMRRMESKKDGQCELCDTNTKGTIIYWNGDTNKAFHEACL